MNGTTSNNLIRHYNHCFRVNLEQTLSNFTVHNDTTSEVVAETVTTRNHTLQIYTTMTLLSTLVNVVAVLVYCKVIKNASLNLHRHMITNVINATMHFFDSTFIGNILNRFSLDFNVIADHLPFMIHQVFRVSTFPIKTNYLNQAFRSHLS